MWCVFSIVEELIFEYLSVQWIKLAMVYSVNAQLLLRLRSSTFGNVGYCHGINLLIWRILSMRPFVSPCYNLVWLYLNLLSQGFSALIDTKKIPELFCKLLQAFALLVLFRMTPHLNLSWTVFPKPKHFMVVNFEFQRIRTYTVPVSAWHEFTLD